MLLGQLQDFDMCRSTFICIAK